MAIFSCEILTILWSNVVNFTSECHAWISMADTVLNKKFGQKFALSMLFLDPNFFKNLGFSQSEHCEWGTWGNSNSI